MSTVKQKPKKKSNGNLIYIIIPLVLFLVMMYFSSSYDDDSLKYSEIVQLFKTGEVVEYNLDLSSGALEYKLASDEVDEEGTETYHEYTLPNVDLFILDVHEGVLEYNDAQENEEDLIVYNYEAGTDSSIWISILPMIIMCGLLFVGMYYLYKKMGQSLSNEANMTMSFGKAKFKMGSTEPSKVKFDDVAGADEEKEELVEIVDFLKDPLKFTKLGARIPTGVLLMGPPGTGKTLLAKAIAGEAGVPFFSISGSDFVEMYVGVGASRVRDLFAQAKKSAPSILFIDEIDAVGRQRGAGMGGGHDEREQTLNQMLVEMDGFGVNEGVIIIAATNRPDVLDPALLRPGRFDRQLTVGLPDVIGREAILKVHSKNKPLAKTVSLKEVAQGTVGFTGADLANLLNEAALLAARHAKEEISMEEIQEATMKTVIGTEKKSNKMSAKEKKLTAYHEAGHALATYYLEGQDPVHQISIIPRGRAGGYTMSLPLEDKSYRTRGDMLDDLVVLLGGRIAEAIIMGDISTGASNDIERATEIARNMVTRYGMSATLGPISFGNANHEVFLGRDYGNTRNYSESIATDIDKEVNAIITKEYDRCYSILEEHLDNLHVVAQYLIVHEKVDGELFKKLMTGEFVPNYDEKTPETLDSVTPATKTVELDTTESTQSESNDFTSNDDE
ncbi:MAG: ATP-dependent zinc metalloprotease FtsH [Clostridia bacterium]